MCLRVGVSTNCCVCESLSVQIAMLRITVCESMCVQVTVSVSDRICKSLCVRVTVFESFCV